jgi:hypothetical protein
MIVSLSSYAQEATNKKKLPKKVEELNVPFSIERLCEFSKMDYSKYSALGVKDVYLKYEFEKEENDPYLFRIYFYDYNLFQKYLTILGLTDNKIWVEKSIGKNRYIIFHKSYDDNGSRLYDDNNRMYFILSITY